MDWITGMQKAIAYIEQNLAQPLDYEEIAKQSFSSSFHFQRTFSILFGITLGEYIRNRRLTLAGMDLISTPENNTSTLSACSISYSFFRFPI